MRPYRTLLTAILCLPLVAGAASFDCTKAANSVERLICADADLSRRDESLAQTYAIAAEAAMQAPGLVLSQRRWLAQRNKCQDRACIRDAYEVRERELTALSMRGTLNCDPEEGMVDTEQCLKLRGTLSTERIPKPGPDPFADNTLTCEEMKRYPDRIFDEDPDLGSGYSSPIEVDYSCKESLASLPFLQKLQEMTETVRADGGPQTCTGTIIHAHWRYYQFRLLMAGFAPDKLIAKQRDEGRRSEEKLFEYFERWAYEGIYNFELHRAYMDELARARVALARHYQRRFRLSQARAERLAQLGTRIFVERAAGTIPADSIGQTARMLQFAATVRGSVEQLKSILDGKDVDYARAALKIALLTQRPTHSHIALLAERAKSLNYDDEPPLFFALRNPSNVRFLLERGADVNYKNGFGKTALFYAIAFNDHRLVELLLEEGASVNHQYRNPAKDEFDCGYQIRSGRTPLMHAAQHADVAMLKLLLRRGARPRDVDADGDNAAAYALRHERHENAAYLESLASAR